MSTKSKIRAEIKKFVEYETRLILRLDVSQHDKDYLTNILIDTLSKIEHQAANWQTLDILKGKNRLALINFVASPMLALRYLMQTNRVHLLEFHTVGMLEQIPEQDMGEYLYFNTAIHELKSQTGKAYEDAWKNGIEAVNEYKFSEECVLLTFYELLGRAPFDEEIENFTR